MDIIRSNKKLICVEYPGIVKNVDTMLKTLGGERSLSQTYNDSSSRMAVRFRPDDIFSKCCHGDRFNTTNMLMKITRRRRKGQKPSDWVVYKVEIMGMIDITYKFRGMFDYQYLPMKRTSEGKYESLLPQLIPKGLELFEWSQGDAPIFIQPTLFARLDQPSNYHFRRDPIHRNPLNGNEEQKHPSNLIGQFRKKRTAFTVLVNFEDKEIPEKPLQVALDQIEAKRVHADIVEKLQKIFEERPIWSKNALAGYSGIDKLRLKFALPVVAYYFSNGPWRTTWTRFNFDPRKETSAKPYQILDFRIHRRIVSDKFMKKTFRRPVHNYKLNTKSMAAPARVGLINTLSLMPGAEQDMPQASESSKDNRELFTYIFRSGYLPALRQTFYQLCDIEVDEVQQVVHSNDGQEKECLDKDGWCIVGALDRCREILYKEVTKTMGTLKKQNVEHSEDIAYEMDSDEEEILSSDDADDESMEID